MFLLNLSLMHVDHFSQGESSISPDFHATVLQNDCCVAKYILLISSHLFPLHAAHSKIFFFSFFIIHALILTDPHIDYNLIYHHVLVLADLLLKKPHILRPLLSRL